MHAAAPHLAIVEDDDSARRAIARLLATYGWESRLYRGGAEFLASLERDVPCCAIIDFWMPVLTGLDVQAALNRAAPRLPVIFITAHDDPGLEAQARAAGASGFFTKPLDQAAFISALEAFRPASARAHGQARRS
jgi:FixJ family two-component response regulator